jgi:uncharacterized protein YkwD
MSHTFQRLTSLVLAVALFLPLSVSAENRSRGRTDLEQLAADLERAFGKGSVQVEGRETTAKGTPFVESVVAAMNRERAAHGLGPLRLESRLSLAAEDRVDDMIRKRYFDHVSPDGVQPFTWVRKRGYRYSMVGENLALGYRSGQSVVTGWMNSPGHRENILQRGFDEVGIAVVEASPMRGYRAPLVVALYASR